MSWQWCVFQRSSCFWGSSICVAPHALRYQSNDEWKTDIRGSETSEKYEWNSRIELQYFGSIVNLADIVQLESNHTSISYSFLRTFQWDEIIYEIRGQNHAIFRAN